jgi:putative peptidoglycan lipid II flippase
MRRISESTSVAAGTIAILLFTIISKGMGFFREMLVANYFGTSGNLDAVFIAMTPATTLSGIIAGALAAIFMPIYHSIRNSDQERSRRYTGTVLLTGSLIFLSMGLILLAIPDLIIKLFAPGFSEETIAYAARKLRYLSIYPLIGGLENLLGTVLKANRRFIQFGISQLIFNVVAIPVIFFTAPFLSEGSYILAWIIGNGLTVMLYAFQSRDLFTFKIDRGTRIVETIYLALPLILSGSLSVINGMVDKAFVSLLPPGRVSSLQYAHTLLGLITFTVSAFQTTAYTELSEYVVAGDRYKIRERLRKTVTSSLNIALPLAVWVISMAEPLVRFIYQRGEFDADSTRLVSTALIGYGALIVLSPVSHTCSSYFIASKKVRLITWISLMSIGLNAMFDWIFLGPLEHAGIAASTSAVIFIATVVKNVLISREGMNFMPYAKIGFLVSSGIGLWLLVFALRYFVPNLVWLIVGNVLFIAFFAYSARSELKAVISKLKGLNRTHHTDYPHEE